MWTRGRVLRQRGQPEQRLGKKRCFKDHRTGRRGCEVRARRETHCPMEATPRGARCSRIPKPFHVRCIVSSSGHFREISGQMRTLGSRERKGLAQEYKPACR